jgi:hypothetical protein
MKQPIDSRIHGFLDYLTGTSLVAASQLPALRGRFAGRALLAAGTNHLGYSLLTDYELGAVKKIPYKVHLALDAGGVVGLAAAGATRDEALDRWLPIGVAVYELGALVLSDPNGQRRKPRNAVTVNRSQDEVNGFLRDESNVRRFARSGNWTGDYELRPAPGERGTEIVADADGNDLRRAKQLLEAGELTTADGPAGRRGVLSAVLPTRDTGANGR